MEQYDEKAWYKFTDKDGNVHYSRGDNGYIWQAYTEGIPLSVNDKGEWYTEPYLEVTPNGFVSHIPDWFKDTKEYSRWMDEFVPQLTSEGASITADRFNQYKDMLSSLGSMGGTRQAYRKFIQDNYNVTDKGLQDAYVDTMYAVQLEGKDKEKAQISGIFGSDQVESAEEIARSFKNLSKEKLAEITTKLYWNMDKAKSGSTNLSQKEIADAVTTMGILSYIDENYKEFGDGEEFKGLLEASEWQKFARQLKSFQQTWAESGIWGIGARFMYGIGEVAAGRDFSLRIEDDRERSYLSPAFGGSLKGLEASDRIGNIAGMAASFATQIIISRGAGYLFNGKIMPMLNLGEKWSRVGTFLQTVPGAMTSDFILNDVPIDGLFLATDLMKYGGDWGKAWENPEEQQNLIPIPGIGEFGPKVPAGLKYNLLGDVIVDLALPIVNIVFGNFHNKLDLLSNGGLTRVEDGIALKNLELQQKLSDLPVVGTGWKKFVNFMMGEADAEKVRLARKAAIAEGSMEPYREVHNLLTLNNHEGAEVVNPMLKRLDKDYKISESVQDFIKNKNQYGGIGETKVAWKDIEPGTIKQGFKGYDDILPRDVKQGLLDIERLSELKGEALADGGIFSNPVRGAEIEKLENKVKKIPKKIRDFADRFSDYNKAMDQLRVELGLTTQQWEDALQADPRWEKYMTRQALVPGGGGPGTGTDPTQAKIFSKSRKGYYAENYLDPYISANMKGVALGRAYAWNEMKKALYSYEAALGNVVAGKGGASTAAKLAEKRAEIKTKEDLKKAIGYDDTVGSFSTDMTAISGSFRRISELLDRPGEISLKSVYGATQNPQIKAIVNDFNNGKIQFAPGVKEAAGLTDSVAADIIQNTYAYNKVNPVNVETPKTKAADLPGMIDSMKRVWTDDDWSNFNKIEDALGRISYIYSATGNPQKGLVELREKIFEMARGQKYVGPESISKIKNTVLKGLDELGISTKAIDDIWLDKTINLDNLKNERGEVDAGIDGLTFGQLKASSKRAKELDQAAQEEWYNTNSARAEKYNKEYSEWLKGMMTSVEDDWKKLTPEEQKADPFAEKLYEKYRKEHPAPVREESTKFPESESVKRSRRRLDIEWGADDLVDSEAQMDYKVFAVDPKRQGREDNFNYLTRGENRRALREKGYDGLSAKEKKQVDLADSAFTQRLVADTVLYRGETKKLFRKLPKVGDKIDSSSWTYTQLLPEQTAQYRHGSTSGDLRQALNMSEGVLYRYHVKGGDPVFHKAAGDRAWGSGTEFILPRGIDATVTGVEKGFIEPKNLKTGKWEYDTGLPRVVPATIVDVEVDATNAIVPSLTGLKDGMAQPISFVDGRAYAKNVTPDNRKNVEGYKQFKEEHLERVKTTELSPETEDFITHIVRPGGDVDVYNSFLRDGTYKDKSDWAHSYMDDFEDRYADDIEELAFQYFPSDAEKVAKEFEVDFSEKGYWDTMIKYQGALKDMLSEKILEGLEGNYRLKDNTILYRGVNTEGTKLNPAGDFSWIKEGGKFKDNGFGFVSLSDNAAKHYADGGKGEKIILEYKVPEGQRLFYFGEIGRGGNDGGAFVLPAEITGTVGKIVDGEDGYKHVEILIGDAAKTLGNAEIKTTAKETIPTLSYNERLSLAKDVVDNSNGEYILLYRMQNGTPDKWRANNRGVEGRFEARGGEPALKGAVWLTADRNWVEGPDRATAGVQSAWTSGEKVTDDNIVVIPVKKSDILNLNQEQNAKVELENSGKKIVKTRGIEGGLGKSEYILWENEHPEIFEEGMELLAERYLGKNLSSPELVDRMVGPSAEMNVPDNLPKDMAEDINSQAKQIGYNAGMSVDGIPYRYEIENGKITKMEKITDTDGLADSVRGITGTYDISTQTVEKLGELNVHAINRALIKYRDNIPIIAEKAVFKVDYDEDSLGWCPKVPATLHVENGKLVADEFEVFLSSNYYAKGKEESTYQYQKSKAGNFHPKNSADLSSTPIHENGHSTSGKLTISILNQRIEEGDLDINRLQNMGSYELKVFFIQERDKIQADILKTAAEKIGIKPTPQNINTQRKTISGYANYDRELARRNSETIAEAFCDYCFNGSDSSPFSQAIVGQFKERMNRFTVAAAPGEVFKKNGLTAKGLFKDDEYAFPKTAKTDAQKAKWLDQWRQKNPYLKGELTEESYRQANLWDTFFQKEIAAYDANTKSVAPDLLIEKNANFLENLSKNSAKMLVQEIKQASIEGFDEALATMALSKKSTDIADAMDEFIINRVEKAANEIASKMPGGATEENLNTARITLWSEESLKNDVVNMVYTMVPNGELAAVQEKIGKLFDTQAEGYASFEALPIDVRQLYGEEKRLQEQLTRDNKYALQKGKEEDAKLKEQGYRNGSKVVSFRDGGETVYVVLNDPLEASLFERPNNYKETNVFWESVAQMSNFLARTYRLGTTGMNPVALVRNILRDPLQATLTAGFSPLSMHLSPDVFFHTLRGYGLDDATISEVSEKIKNWASSNTLTQEIRNFSNTRVGSTGYRSKAEKYIKKFNQGATENKIVRLGEKPLEMWESMFRTQVGQQSFMRNYQRTRDVNKALGAALFDTSNATTNFSHSVAHLRRATSTIPYLTSAINGSTSFWRLFNMNPVRMITRLTAGFMVPAMAITAWNLSDKEKRQAYLNLPEWFRQGHIVLLDNENNVFALPIPEEIDQFYNVARKYIEFTQESTPFALPTIMAQGVFGFLPLDVDGFFGDDGSIQIGRGVAQLANGIMPQAATAIYELVAKENLFTGQDISDYDGWNTFLNTSSNILGTGWKQVINSIGLMCGVPESRLVGKSVENTLARDLFGISFDDATTQFMRLVGHPSEIDPDTNKETKATGLFAESEDLAKKIEKIEDDIIFASEDQKAELEKKKQDLINDFTQRVANLTNKYMQLYTVTGGLEDWKKKKIVQILTLGQSISSGDSLTYQYNEANQAGLDERGLALQRYVDAGLPAQADQYSFADSIDLQAAVNRFYGTNKQATQDFKNAVEQSGMKDVKDEFYSVINQIYDAAEEQNKQPDYDLIEKIQARYLQMMDSALIPLINQYGINVLNNNDFIDAVRRQVNGMIPSDDWRQSAKNAKRFLSTKEFPTATVDVKKWLKSRYSSGMRDRGLDSDPEVTERIESIRADIDAGRMAAAAGKIEDLKKGVNKANFYISSKDLMTLNDLQNMVK